jgi:CRISPR-associated endonuclease/helicase Cas3
MATTRTTRPLPFWAKTRDDQYHPLIAHSADVAAVFRSLVSPTAGLRRALARASGTEGHDLEELVARLTYLAALHDLGKASHGFQEKAGLWRTGRRFVSRGHLGSVLGTLQAGRSDFKRLMRDVLAPVGIAADQELDVLLTVIGHHGRPLPPPTGHGAPSDWQRLWAHDQLTGRDPLAEVERLSRCARSWAALDPDRGELHWTPAVSHLFAGLLTVADWLGSHEGAFRFEPSADDDPGGYWAAALDRARAAVRATGIIPSKITVAGTGTDILPSLFPKVFLEHEPTRLQRLMAAVELPAPGSRVVLESETGSGKTEAVLTLYHRLRAAGRVDGLVFALPTRATASAMFARLVTFLDAQHGSPSRPPVALAIGGREHNNALPRALSPAVPEHPDEGTHPLAAWSSEGHKRAFGAEVVVSTLDQVLLAGLPVRHAHMRLALLSRHLIVVDELHSYDRYMATILRAVTQFHAGLGGVSIFLSATLSRGARAAIVGEEPDEPLEAARVAPYPSVSVRPGHESAWQEIPTPSDRAERRVAWGLAEEEVGFAEAHRLATAGACVCILRNTVKDAARTARMLAETGAPLWTPAPNLPWVAYHSRFIPADRRLLDDGVLHAFGKDGVRPAGVVLVATQVVEQSLDLDFDWMFTDLAPIDVLLQRMGRVHRHARGARPSGAEVPRLLVHAPPIPLMAHSRHKGPFGWGTVYEGWMDLELTRRVIAGRPDVTIPGDNRTLVEGVYHPEAITNFVTEFPEWGAARDEAMGLDAARHFHAATLALDFSKTYQGHAGRFHTKGEDEERVRTRIGDDQISVRLDEPVQGRLDLNAWYDRVDVRASAVFGAGGVDLVDPVAALEARSEEQDTYLLGDRLELSYSAAGWSWRSRF